MTECLGRFTLVCRANDDLEVDQRERVEAHLRTCKFCRDRLEEVTASLDDYRKKLPAHSEALRHRLGRERDGLFGRRFAWPLAASLASVSVVVCALVLWPGDTTVSGPKDSIKGAMGVRVVAQQGDTQVVLHSGASLAPDHRLRFELTTEAPGFLTAFSVAADGQVSPLYPETDPTTDPSPWVVPAAGVQTLPDAVSLDILPGGEWIVIFFSRQSFDRHKVHAGLVASDSLALDAATLRQRAGRLGGVAEVLWFARAARD